jgi:hypothetical protein
MAMTRRTREKFQKGRMERSEAPRPPRRTFKQWRVDRKARREERRKTPIDGAVKSANRKKAFGRALLGSTEASKAQAARNRKIIQPPDYTKRSDPGDHEYR